MYLFVTFKCPSHLITVYYYFVAAALIFCRQVIQLFTKQKIKSTAQRHHLLLPYKNKDNFFPKKHNCHLNLVFLLNSQNHNILYRTYSLLCMHTAGRLHLQKNGGGAGNGNFILSKCNVLLILIGKYFMHTNAVICVFKQHHALGH